jgi:phospholipid/cholesterol/gamma-HCH transport system substrate-binding protein
MTPKNKPKTELYVGIFVFCGLILLGGLILKFGDFRYAFREKYPLTLVFTDAGNLTTKSPVRRGGVEVGRVTKDPSLIEGISGVRVPLVIYSEYLIAKGSVFTLKSDGIIGDTYIEVTPPAVLSGEMIESGSELRGAGGSDISAAATRVADKSLVVLEDIRASLVDVKGAINKISTGVLGEDNLANFRQSLKGLNDTIAKFNKEVLSEENTTDLNATLKSLKESSEKLSTSLNGVKDTIASANTVIDKKLAPALDEFGKAGTSLRKTAESFGIVANDMHGAPGLFSALLRDPKLKNDFSSAISNFRRHGFLWYKDDAEALKNATPADKKDRKGLFSR